VSADEHGLRKVKSFFLQKLSGQTD